MYCVRHPDTETNLRCGKCEQPICPKCLVQTPVGARCPDCAAVKRLPVYTVTATSYARAVPVGFITGSALGAVWPLIPYGGFIILLIAMGIGYAISEVVSLSVNRKRGVGLQVIAGLSMLLSYVVRSLLYTQPQDFLNSFVSLYGLIALVLGIIVAVSKLR